MTDIYLITNHAVSPNMYYVGRTDGDLDKRFVEHVRLASRQNNRLLHEAILEYGKRNFTIQLLDSVDENISAITEEKYIKQYNSHYRDGQGYNMRYEHIDTNKHYHGADIKTVQENLANGYSWNKGIPFSEEAKNRVSKTKIHRSKLGLYDGKYGHKQSEETKLKLSEIAKNRPPPSRETRDKLRENFVGRKCYYNPEEKKRLFLKNDQEIPSGYIKGKGSIWLNDGKNAITVDLWKKEEYIRNGYTEGRMVHVGKDS